ncbi:MAG TPA: hypothetical protein VKB48_11045 [Candidatus Acidoferrum sp.]|nr:hypothetical protein [Candidatus Acidoferrum sp.]
MFYLLFGFLLVTLLLGAISVYIFHDVDKEMAGQWDLVFIGLAVEALIFLVGITMLAITLTHLKQVVPNPKVG